MKDKKLLLLVSLLLVGSLLACGLGMAGQTWAFPTVAEKNREQLDIGMVECKVRILLDGEDALTDRPLDPGSYTVEISAVGDAEGWFRMWLFAPSGDSESASYRTGQLQPGQSVTFDLKVAEPAWITVESRWDMPDEDSGLLYEGVAIYWGVPEADAAEETETTEPETEATEPETEATEPETEATEPETEATEPETEATEPETEATEPETEPETEATEPETEATEPETEPTESATEEQA